MFLTQSSQFNIFILIIKIIQFFFSLVMAIERSTYHNTELYLIKMWSIWSLIIDNLLQSTFYLSRKFQNFDWAITLFHFKRLWFKLINCNAMMMITTTIKIKVTLTLTFSMSKFPENLSLWRSNIMYVSPYLAILWIFHSIPLVIKMPAL